MFENCSKSLDTAFSPNCEQWYLTNPTYQDAVMNKVCNTPPNINSIVCQNWCRKNSGKCDLPSLNYCTSNPGKIYCSCLTSPVTKYNPACVDTKCISGSDPNDPTQGVGGYISATMLAKDCPNIIDCETQILLTSEGRLATGNVSVAQNCGGDQPSTTPTSAPLQPGTMQPQQQLTSTTSKVQTFMWWGLIFLLVVIAMITSIFIVKFIDKKLQSTTQAI